MKAILTKYLGPTNFRGSRIKAYDEDNNSIIISWNHAWNVDQNHCYAASQLIKKMGWDCIIIGSGSIKTGYAHIMCDIKKG